VRGRLLAWARDWRHTWDGLGRLQAEAAVQDTAPVFYGRLGEMGHPDDRADDWPPCDTGVSA
jgi:hypothetical protein